MQKHILKRIGIFSFWLVLTLVIVYLKEKPKDITELIFSSFFAVFLLILLSSIFLLYESVELKKHGNLKLYKTNRIIGFISLSVLVILAIIFIRGAILTF
jgi:Mn2+/Fe2+ NRAMP family transporter